jgi:hypothetical protein
MNSMTIFGLSSFSGADAISQPNYIKFKKKLFISNKVTWFTKLLTNADDSIKNKNMTERSLSKRGILISS